MRNPMRIATVAEALRYGASGLARRGLTPPIAGGASYAQVGSLGPVVESTSGGTPPALSFGQSPSAGNLLICWAAVGGSATAPTTPTGWTAPGAAPAGTSCTVVVFTKIAAGGDAAPSFASITSATQAFQLGEFLGNPLASTLDRTGSATSTTSPITASNAAGNVSARPGELNTYACVEWYSVAATATNTVTLTNGATVNDTNNNAVADQLHYNFGWGIPTTNAAADAVTLTFTTTNIVGTAQRIVSSNLSIVPSFSPHRLPQGV